MELDTPCTRNIERKNPPCPVPQPRKNPRRLHSIGEERHANKDGFTQADIKDSESEEEGEIKEESGISPNVDVSKYEVVRRRGRGSFLFGANLVSYATPAFEQSPCTSLTSIAFSDRTNNFLSRKSRLGVVKKAAWKAREAASLRSRRRLEEKMLALQDLIHGKTVVASMRPSDMVWSQSMLTPGTAISAPQHSSARTDYVHPEDTNLSFSSYGAVHSKYRMMIVMENWGEHSTCLPLYSYQGRGLDMRQEFANEYISVRNDDSGMWEPRDNSVTPLRAKKLQNWKGQFISGRTVVKLTERCNLYQWDKCSIEGYILPEDFERLWHAYSKISTDKMKKSIEEAWSRMALM